MFSWISCGYIFISFKIEAVFRAQICSHWLAFPAFENKTVVNVQNPFVNLIHLMLETVPKSMIELPLLLLRTELF